MKKRMLLLVLVVTVMLQFVACGPGGSSAPGQNGGSNGAGNTETMAFTDDAQRTVILPEEITRVMPAGPIAQQILLALAPDMLVGLADDFSEGAEQIIPEEYTKLPYLGQLYRSADMNVEALALAAPQVVIDIGQSMSSGEEDMASLQNQTGIPTIYLYSDLKNMPEVYRTLGLLLGRQERAEELAVFCENIYDRTEKILARVGDQKVRTLYVLFGDGSNVLAKGSYHADMLDWLTDNVAVVDSPSSKGSGNTVDMEQIALWDPDFVIFSSESIYDTVAEDPVWSHMDAIAEGAFVEVPDAPHNWMGNPPGVQRYLSLIWLPAILYPDHCDYDMKADVLEFYRLFYNCELTDARYEELVANAFPMAAGQ